MNMFVIDQEFFIRLGSFAAVFVLMALWELAAPRRALTAPRGRRWTANLGITLLNAAAVRLLFPAAAVGAAVLADARGWGILRLLGFSELWAGTAAFVLLDCLIYWQHAIFHRVPLFWRLHLVHHTDLDIDVTTGARFHTIEILLSMLIKIAVVVLLGAPGWSVVLFEVVLNATSMFNHSNVRMPAGLDNVLRRIVVTPDMHRVHHSVLPREYNSNFGFSFSWWDRLFGTYTAQPAAGHQEMTIGLAPFRDSLRLSLPFLLALPFRLGRK